MLHSDKVGLRSKLALLAFFTTFNPTLIPAEGFLITILISYGSLNIN